MNVSKSKVMRCSGYENWGGLEAVDCFMYLGLQVAADGGSERDVVLRMNVEY